MRGTAGRCAHPRTCAARRRRRRHAAAQGAARFRSRGPRAESAARGRERARRRVVSVGRRAPAETRFARSSPSSKGATTIARSVSCRTREVTSGCGRSPTSSRRSGTPPTRGVSKCSCSARSSTTTRRRTIRPVTSPACSSASARFRASSASDSRVRTRGTSRDRLIDAIRDLPKVAKHLHLPVQSGSDRVLAAMRRRHTREQYLDQVRRLREAVPDIDLSTDVIVGFPGETDEDFDADARPHAAGPLSLDVLVQVLRPPEYPRVETHA